MSLKHAAASGMKWSSASMVIATLLQFAKYFILAHILPPEDFGLMALVIVFLTYGFSFADVGINKALIHFQDTTREQRSTLYWLTIASASLLTLTLALLAPVLAMPFGDERLVGLLRVASISFVIGSFGQQFQMLLQKELRFKLLGVINVSSVFLGTVVAVASGFSGLGVWSLLWGSLATMVLRSLMLLAVGMRQWPPALVFKLSEIRKYLSFGFYQLGTRVVMTFYSSFDQLLIGALIGPEALGYYSMAYLIVATPIARISLVVYEVMFPILAKVQNEVERLRRGYYRILKLLMIVNVPLMVGMLAVAPEFVSAVLGAKWLPAIQLIQILALVSLFRSTLHPLGSLQLAIGQADVTFKWNLGITFIHIIGVAIGANWGAIGVAVVQLILQISYTMASYFLMIRPVLGPSLGRYVKSIIEPCMLAIVMAVTVLLLPFILPVSGVVLLAVQIIVGAAIYISLTLLLQGDEVRELGQLLLNR